MDDRRAELNTLPEGSIRTPNGLLSGLWALPRPCTGHWGSGALLDRIEQVWGPMSVIFGKQDNVTGFTVDIAQSVAPTVAGDWESLPFPDLTFESGFWDPPYEGYIGPDGDVHYSRLEKSRIEICRVLSFRLLILHSLVYPCPVGWKREAVIAVTYGPNKVIRCLQSFVRQGFHLALEIGPGRFTVARKAADAFLQAALL